MSINNAGCYKKAKDGLAHFFVNYTLLLYMAVHCYLLLRVSYFSVYIKGENTNFVVNLHFVGWIAYISVVRRFKIVTFVCLFDSM